MQLQRGAGILLHPTSLPSSFGIGDLGDGAYRFIDFLKNSGQRIWQILPLNPIGFGESPYQPYSAFAGNYYLIDPLDLRNKGLISDKDLADFPCFANSRVEYDYVIPYKLRLFRIAYRRFRQLASPGDYQQFLHVNSYWLPDYAFFMALKEHLGGLPWNQWPEDLATRKAEALNYYRNKLEQEIEFHCFVQYIFACQWCNLLDYAHKNGIKLMGDIPIFVAADSCDTWVNPQWYELSTNGCPSKVAGVPPDYFSKTGQRWGNPLYRWEEMKKDGYSWWIARFRYLLTNVDYVRVDHFRGFAAYWNIAAEEETAVNGCWVEGPGKHFFQTLTAQLGDLPIVAEDLGYITQEVRDLKEYCGFPGMKVLQFIKEERWPAELAHDNVVYYTGTHDNDTLLGWYCKEILAGLNRPYINPAVCWEFIEALYSSNAAWVIVPMQDLLCLGSEARMNTPGTVGANWSWRLEPGALTRQLAGDLASLCHKYSR